MDTKRYQIISLNGENNNIDYNRKVFISIISYMSMFHHYFARKHIYPYNDHFAYAGPYKKLII